MSKPSHPRRAATAASACPLPRAPVTILKLGVAGTLVTFASLALAACSAAPDAPAREEPAPTEDVADAPAVSVDEAIVHGAADKGRHPSVVALLARDAAGASLCTGALVAPDLVLTARHCVSYLRSEIVSCPSSAAQIRGDRAPSSIAVLAGDDTRTAKEIARGAEILAPRSAVLCGNDVALLRLDRPVHALAPMKVSARAPLVGRTITAVGYGLASTSGAAGAKRFRSDVPILKVDATELVVGEASCSGDSGGPAIDERTGEIVGVVSRGPQPCEGAGGNIYTRADRLAATIAARLAATVPDEPEAPLAPDAGGADAVVDVGADVGAGAAATSDMGDPCERGGQCATGLCVRASAAGYCSRRCGTGQQRCPAGYHCAKTADAGGLGVCGKV